MSKRTSLYPTGVRKLSAYSEDLESQVTVNTRQKNLHVANTYKMKPDVENIFRAEKVKKKVDSILSKKIGDTPYDASKSKKLCIDLATEIKDEVKSLGFKRHKLVSHVTITSSHGQSLRQASRSIWDVDSDSYVSCVYSNATMDVVAVLYAIYFE